MSGADVIEIDALEFEGLDEAAARRAAAAFKATLGDLLDRYGLPDGVRSRDFGDVRLDALPASADTPEGVGRALARALFRRVAR